MRKFLLSGLLGIAFCVTSVKAADVGVSEKPDMVVHPRPPKVVTERRPPSPGPEYVWIDGYQRWNSSKYAWQPGHWEMPPHEHAVWMAPRWQRREGGYVFTPGWWT